MMRQLVAAGLTMKAVLCAGLMTMLASTPAIAEPAMRVGDRPLPASDRLPGDRHLGAFWFFGDGGFDHSWWQRERRPGAESSDDWFFGDGGFGCPVWWCKHGAGQR
jgi:hypothetical protein